ncbi:tail fiber domain-containing protein [Cellulosispirillum alkaliphilum]|uniref:tail fiber domain-containing protein n=1 Tax=Cellulosispirillum alkaliphilum TaxID=3039283 RepID=UPI003D6E2169
MATDPSQRFLRCPQIGFIAQEVEKVLPELVHTNDEGYKSLSYDKLTAVLLEAIKEQQAIIEELKSVNEKQSAEIALQNELLTKQQSEIEAIRAFVGME